MKVGDLVRLKQYCRNAGSLAVIVEEYRGAAKILELDTGCVISAIKDNLELVCQPQ